MRYILLVISVLSYIFGLAQSSVVFDSLGIIAPGAKLQKISSQFSFTEGPVADKKGNIYFTDQPNNKIWYYNTPSGTMETFLSPSGRVNGLALDKEGNIVACADENNELWRITPGKKITVLLSSVGGKKLNGPNDLWIDKKDGIYFTDPYYQRDYWKRKASEIKEQNVYYLPKAAKQPIVVSSELNKPNGIVGPPDGRYLFVADIGDNKTYQFSINPDGGLSHKKLFAAQGSDGITIDKDGNLYLTGNGITVYNTNGIKIAYIPVPEKWVGNICFGGKNRHMLFITAGTSIYTLQMSTNGVD